MGCLLLRAVSNHKSIFLTFIFILYKKRKKIFKKILYTIIIVYFLIEKK